MNNLPPTMYIAIGAVVAALIAAFISTISLAVAKESKVSEFRQNWIDELRKELSKLISLVNYLALTYILIDTASEEEFKSWLQKRAATSMEIDELTHRLRMRLNPEEHQELISIILKFDEITASPEELANQENLQKIYNRFTTESQRVLKKEWARVKEGEGLHKAVLKHSKIIAFLSFFALILLIVMA